MLVASRPSGQPAPGQSPPASSLNPPQTRQSLPSPSAGTATSPNLGWRTTAGVLAARPPGSGRGRGMTTGSLQDMPSGGHGGYPSGPARNGPLRSSGPFGGRSPNQATSPFTGPSRRPF